MNNIIDPDKEAYELYGYIDDGSLYGFKTPVFMYGNEYFIQDAGGDAFNERIDSFIKIDPNEEREILPLGEFNSYYEHQSQVGLRPVFLFLNGSENKFFGQKRKMFHFLHRWSYQDESNNPFVYLDVLYFIGAPKNRIENAIGLCATQLKIEGADYWESWVDNQNEILNSYISQEMEDDSKLCINLSTNREKLRQSIESEFNELNEYEKSLYETYLHAKHLIDSDRRESFKRGVREIFSALAMSDHKLSPLSELRLLMRIEYAEAIWKNLHFQNKKLIKNNKTCPQIEKHDLEDFLVCDSENLIVNLFRLLSNYFYPNLCNDDIKPQTILFAKSRDWRRGEMEISNCKFKIDSSLKPVIYYHEGPPDDQYLMVNMRNSYECTARGEEYIRSALNLFAPGLIPKKLEGGGSEHILKHIYMGASNSWGTVICKGINIKRMTEGGGRLLQQLSYAVGLRRLTLVEKSNCSNQERWLKFMNDFVSVSWSDCHVENIGDFSIKLIVNNIDPEQENISFLTPFTQHKIKPLDYRKVITFISMFEKIFLPRFKYVLVTRIDQQEFDLKNIVKQVYKENKEKGTDRGFSTDWSQEKKSNKSN